MLLFWKIRYLDSRDREFKDRNLYLETDTLDAATQAALEFLCNERQSAIGRDLLKYRHLFKERFLTDDESQQLSAKHSAFSSVCVHHDYFEDENGNELSRKRMGEILTGNPNVVPIPYGAKNHDIQYMLAPKSPVAIETMTISDAEIECLAYFCRDLKEMLQTAFYREGPGSLHAVGDREPTVETTVTSEEIGAFLQIFRRLYSEREPGQFCKAAEACARGLGDHPLGAWIRGSATSYQEELVKPPEIIPFFKQNDDFPYSRKRLIDVYLYTRFAHQPDERRDRQFKECLTALGGRRSMLTWLFLCSLQTCAYNIRNPGVQILRIFEAYCIHHNVVSNVLGSIGTEHPGIGMREKPHVRRERLLKEAVESLAQRMWAEQGCPQGGHTQFIAEAERIMREKLNPTSDKLTG